jgi:hypothetical protein
MQSKELPKERLIKNERRVYTSFCASVVNLSHRHLVSLFLFLLVFIFILLSLLLLLLFGDTHVAQYG